ncbi:MAG: phenylalanine--tRNA ligase subunit beta, partial [Tepidimonas sp.]|uniref:phenylalanine--tRNA ligase subunit beta n=1 Tax=Tepidimonas sp. TaxID=2002775 RepID=UPI0040550E4B
GPIDDHVVNVPQPQPVTLRVARAARVIGMPLTQTQCAEPLRRLGLDVVEGDGTLTVTPPPYRFDLQIEEDLIEEVARVIGYDRLPETPPLAPVVPRVRPETQRSPHALRRQLAQLGYQETINFSFVDERWERDYAGNAEPIRLLNPIASHLSVMRSSLIGSLLAALKYNTDRKVPRARLFEIGRVFRRDDSVVDSDTTVAGVDQPLRVAGLAWGDESALQWGVPARPVDFYDVKGDVETLLAPRRAVFEPAQHPALHPGRCARVLLGGRPVGIVGELHPRWRQAEGWTHAPVLFELDLDAVLAHPVPVARPVSRHQPVQRDIAIVVREAVTHGEVMAAIGALDQPWLREAVLFDVYRPKAGAVGALADGEKSLAVRLTLERHDANLTDDEIDAVVQTVLAALQQRVGARLRA